MARMRNITSPLTGVLGALGGSFVPGVGPSAGYRAGYDLGETLSSWFGGPRSQPQRGVTYAEGAGQPQDRYRVEDLPRGRQAIEMPLYSAPDEAALGQLRDRGLAALQNLPQAEFGPISQEAQRQYQEQVIPRLMEQFRGTGGLRTGGFRQALGAAGTGLQSKLAEMQQLFNQQRRGQEQAYGMGLTRAGLGRKFETDVMQPDPSALDAFGGNLLQGLGAYGSTEFANPISRLFDYLLEQKTPETEEKKEQLRRTARAVEYERRKKQASLPLTEGGY